MFSLRCFFLLISASFASSAYAQEGRLVVVDSTSKELKRSAHRLHIPPEQLKNARQVLQEATDLARKMDPPPFYQYSNLVSQWTQLNPSRTKSVAKSMLDDLRSAAQKARDLQAYQRATTAALPILNQIYPQDSDRVLDEVRRWPAPPASSDNGQPDYRADFEKQLLMQNVSRLAATDPEQALALMSQQGSDMPGYFRGQIAQSLMNYGKQDQALAVIDDAMSYYGQHTSDPRLSQEYDNFVRSALPVMDTQRALTVLSQIIAQPGPESCTGSLKVGAKTLDLTCGEAKAISLLRYPSKPSLTMKVLDSLPGLKTKLEGVGGPDVLAPGSMGATPVQFSSPIGGWSSGGPPQTDTSSIYQELRGKTESDPAFVRGKLQEIAKGPEDVDKLINLAQRVAYEDPELGSLALGFAKPLISLVEPIQKRSMGLQKLIRAYRQVDGEVDSDILRDGFILADQMRRDEKERIGKLAGSGAPMMITRGGNTPADQLESFLISELARDNFDSAMRYVRSMPDDSLKLTCMVQITQSLRQPNF